MARAIPDVLQFTYELIVNNVVPALGNATLAVPPIPNRTSLNGTNAAMALEQAQALVRSLVGRVTTVVERVRDVACLFPPVALGVDLALIATMIIGQGVCVAGCLVCGVALIRSKRGLLAAGMVLVFVGCGISLISFALSAPMSVWVDDACFTVSGIWRSALLAQLDSTVLLACSKVEEYRATIQGFLNSTRFFYATVLIPVLRNVSLAAPDMVDSVLTSGSNFEIVDRFLNLSLVPAIALLRSVNLTALPPAAADAVRGSSVLMEGVQVATEALQRLGDCDAPLFRAWLERVSVFMCADLSQGLIMSVWGTFTAAVAMLLCVVLIAIGSPLMDNNQTSIRAAACLILAITGSVSSLVVALVGLYGSNNSTSIIGLLFANFAVLFLAFLDLSIPLRFWKTERWVRVCWAISSGFSFCAVVFSAVLLGLVVPALMTCWARDVDTCLFGCTTGRVTAVTVAAAVAVFTLIGSLVILAFSVYFVFVVPPLKPEFSELIEFDFALHAVDVATLKPVARKVTADGA